MLQFGIKQSLMLNKSISKRNKNKRFNKTKFVNSNSELNKFIIRRQSAFSV